MVSRCGVHCWAVSEWVSALLIEKVEKKWNGDTSNSFGSSPAHKQVRGKGGRGMKGESNWGQRKREGERECVRLAGRHWATTAVWGSSPGGRPGRVWRRPAGMSWGPSGKAGPPRLGGTPYSGGLDRRTCVEMAWLLSVAFFFVRKIRRSLVANARAGLPKSGHLSYN